MYRRLNRRGDCPIRVEVEETITVVLSADELGNGFSCGHSLPDPATDIFCISDEEDDEDD